MEKQIPKLRFPEFKEAWNKKKLGEIAIRVTTKNNSNDVKNVFTNSAVQGIVNQRDFFDKDIANQNNLLNYYVVEKNDFIYNPRISNYAPVGPISRNHIGQGVMSPLYSVFKFKTGNLDFIETYFSTTLWYEYLESIANYGARFDRMNITVKDFYEMPLPFPTLSEQTRIAYFIKVLDKKIAQLKQKKNLLEQYKKGVMQKIFSQELTFKDENEKDFPKWEKRKFSEYIKLYRGSSPRPINKFTTNESNGINWIKIGDTKNSENYLIESVEEKITIEGSKNSRKVIKGELILANSMSFGKTYLLNIDGCIYDGWFVLREFESYYYRDFLHQLLNSEFLQMQYKTLSTGGVVQNISSEIVYSTILLKPSLPEQTKIANFLSAIDEKINRTENQIQQTQEYKKGLLQNMFC